MVGVCPKCAEEFDLGMRVGAKLGGAAVGALLGGAKSDWRGVLVGALIGGAIGHIVDEEVLPSCPRCRVALEIFEAVL